MQLYLVEFIIVHVFICSLSLCCFLKFIFPSFASLFLLMIVLNYIFCLFCFPIYSGLFF